MQPIRKKQRRPMKHGRLLVLLVLVALLAGSVGIWYAASRPEETTVQESAIRSGTLYAYGTADVASLRITLRDGESWQLTQTEDETLAVDGDKTYQVAESKRASLLAAASVITYEEVLTEDASAYAENFADFGLETPRIIAEIIYRDGTAVTVRIGDDTMLEEAGWSYMTIDGDPRLYALDQGTADALAVKKDDLHPVEQPMLHKVRMDHITFTGENGQIQAQWTLEGGIGGDANDRWLLTVPLQYPADGESMSNLLDNLENLRLGTYVGEATAENLTQYGFDAPRFVITLHMAEGSMGSTNDEGVYEVSDWPEGSFTLTVGGAKNEYVDYVLVEDSIYQTSHFSLATFMNMDPANTLTRYVAPSALGNLSMLTIETEDGKDEYVLTRTEQVAQNNELVYDENDNIVYDVTCSCNGTEISYASFEAAYNELLVVTVSGTLPSDWTTEEHAHTTFTFTQSDGTVHTVELVPYDAFHDAVMLNGNALFYLIKDGMNFQLE